VIPLLEEDSKNQLGSAEPVLRSDVAKLYIDRARVAPVGYHAALRHKA